MIVIHIKDNSNPKARWYSTTVSDKPKLEEKIKEKVDDKKIRAKLSQEFNCKPDDILRFWIVNE